MIFLHYDKYRKLSRQWRLLYPNYLYPHSEVNITLITSDYDNFIRAMRTEKKESYWIRIKRIEADLLKFGISTGSVRRLIYCYPLGVLERLIKATEKRQPREPATYFLSGLKKSRMKHMPERSPIRDEEYKLLK